jgi:hypothetical protein
MTLDNPAILQEGIGPLVVPQVDTLASVTYDVAGTRVSRWTVPDKFLEVADVVGCDWNG